MCNRRRILIADGHNLVAELCKQLLEPEFHGVGTVANGRDLLCEAKKLKPDVIVIDIAMPILNGLDAGKQVKDALLAVKLVYLTMNSDRRTGSEGFDRGAPRYLLKNLRRRRVDGCRSKGAEGNRYLTPTLKEKVTHLRWEQKNWYQRQHALRKDRRKFCGCLRKEK